MRCTSRRRRGMAMLLVVMAIGLLAVTMLMLTRSFAADARRTRHARIDAQGRQLLLAGAHVALARLNEGRPLDQPLTPPEAAGGTIHLQPQPARQGEAAADVRQVTVVAVIDQHAAGQRAVFRRVDDRWTLTEVEHLPADALATP